MAELIAENEEQADSAKLSALFRIAWRDRALVAVITITFTILACLASFVLPKSYIASTVIAPVTSASSGSLGGIAALASQLGGLASLAGVSVSGDTKKYESLAVLQSEALTERYIGANNLLPVLFSRKWDSTKSNWTNLDPQKIPTVWQGNQYFKRLRSVTTDTKTGLVTLAIRWKDPATAARWVNDLVRLTNEYLRDKAISEAEADISYLTEQANKTDVVAVKQGIYTMLQSEINKIMTAKGTDEFALRVIDASVPPEKPASPQPVVWTLEGFFGGLIVGLLIAFNRKQRVVES